MSLLKTLLYLRRPPVKTELLNKGKFPSGGVCFSASKGKDFVPCGDVFIENRINWICWKSVFSLREYTTSTIKMASTTAAAAELPAAVKAKLDQIPDVKIDESGKFKYILIKVYVEDKDGHHDDSHSKTIVRGRADCPYHGDVFDKYQEETSKIQGIDADILGGGRIERTGNKIFVFGYSQGYGKADHNLTCELIKKDYPSHNITCSDEGY